MKQLKIAILKIARALGLFALLRRANASGIRILCYHGVHLTDRFPEDGMYFHPSTFVRRIEAIHKLGYQVVPLQDAVDAVQKRRAPLTDAVVITFDDGWYSTFSQMWPVLKQHRMPATLYVDTGNIGSVTPVVNGLGAYMPVEIDVAAHGEHALALYRTIEDRFAPESDRMAALRELATRTGFEAESLIRLRTFQYMTVDELRTVASEGLGIELHSHNHTIGDHAFETIWSEVDKNRTALAGILGREPASFTHFCYPSGECSPAAAGALARCEIASATTTNPGIARIGDDVRLLPRLLDTPSWSDIEFEAELCGFAEFIRKLQAGVSKMRPSLGNSRRRPADPATA